MFSRRNKALIVIVCCAFLLRIIIFLAVKPYDQDALQARIMSSPDAEGYHNRAVNILETGTFSAFRGLRTPGYPLFISFIYAFFGVKPWIVLLVQVLISTGIMIMVYMLGKLLFSKMVALVASGLCTVDPHMLFYTVHLVSDIVFVFVFLASILALMYGLKNKKIGLFLLSGILLGVATLVRPITQYFPIVTVVIILFYTRIRFLFRSKAAICFVLVFFVVISPWLCRNYNVYGHFSLSPVVKSFNLLYRHVAFTEVAKTGKSIKQVRREFAKEVQERGVDDSDPYYKLLLLDKMSLQYSKMNGENHFDSARVYNEIATNYLMRNWKYYLPLHIKGIIIIFLDPSTRNFFTMLGIKTHESWYLENHRASANIFEIMIDYFKINSVVEIVVGIFIVIFFLIVYASFFVGFFGALSERKYFILAAFLIIILYFPNLAGIMCENRYKLPVIPFYTILSANGMMGVLRFYKCKKS